MVRLKYRYIICELSFQNGLKKIEISAKDIFHGLRNEISSDFGDFGVGVIQSTLQVYYFNKDTRIALIRCDREHKIAVQTALTLLKEIKGQDVRFRTIRLCGCGSTCKLYLLKISRERIYQLQIFKRPKVVEDILKELESLNI